VLVSFVESNLLVAINTFTLFVLFVLLVSFILFVSHILSPEVGGDDVFETRGVEPRQHSISPSPFVESSQ